VNVGVAEGTTGTLAADRFSGVQNLVQIGNAIALSGVSAETVAGFKDLTVDETVDVGFNGEAGNINLDQAGFAEEGAIQVSGDALKTLNLTGGPVTEEGNPSPEIVLQSEAAVETLNVAFQSDAPLNLGS